MQINKKLIKKNWLALLIAVFLLINVVLGMYNFLYLKNRKVQNIQKENPFAISPTKERDFIFNSISPEFTALTYEGRNINLSHLKGNVIILRFSKLLFLIVH